MWDFLVWYMIANGALALLLLFGKGGKDTLKKFPNTPVLSTVLFLLLAWPTVIVGFIIGFIQSLREKP